MLLISGAPLRKRLQKSLNGLDKKTEIKMFPTPMHHRLKQAFGMNPHSLLYEHSDFGIPEEVVRSYFKIPPEVKFSGRFKSSNETSNETEIMMTPEKREEFRRFNRLSLVRPSQTLKGDPYSGLVRLLKIIGDSKNRLKLKSKDVGVAVRSKILTSEGVLKEVPDIKASEFLNAALSNDWEVTTRARTVLDRIRQYKKSFSLQGDSGLTISTDACTPFQLGRCPKITYLEWQDTFIWDSATVKTWDLANLTSIKFGKTAERVTPAVSLMCPKLAHFSAIDPQDLRCGDLEAELQEVFVGTGRFVTPESITRNGPVCQCKEYILEQKCYTNFFGPKEKESKEYESNTTDANRCISLCENLLNTGASSLVELDDQGYDCWWLQSRVTKSRFWRATRQSARIYGPTQSITGGPVATSDCRIGRQTYCPGLGNSIVVPMNSLEKYIPSIETKEIKYEIHRGTEMYSQLTVPGLGSTYIFRQCVACYYGSNFVLAIDNTMWMIETRDYIGLPCCNITAESVTKYPGSMDPMFMRSNELRRELLNCLTRRQVVANTIASGYKLDPALLEGLTLKDRSNFVIAPYKGLLFGATCSPTRYDSLLYLSPDVWLARYDGVVVGCLDARLNALFDDCYTYNETSKFIVDKQWRVESQGDSYIAKRIEDSPETVIGLIADLDQSFTQHLDNMLHPPVYPPNQAGSTIVNEGQGQAEIVYSPFDWFTNMSLIGKIGTVFGVIIGIFLACAVLSLLVKACKQ